MKVLASISLLAALISLAIGIVARLMVVPITFAPGIEIEARAFLAFTNTCLLIAITLILLGIARKKQ